MKTLRVRLWVTAAMVAVVAAFTIPAYLSNRQACKDWQGAALRVFQLGIEVEVAVQTNPAIAADTRSELGRIEDGLNGLRPFGCPGSGFPGYLGS